MCGSATTLCAAATRDDAARDARAIYGRPVGRREGWRMPDTRNLRLAPTASPDASATRARNNFAATEVNVRASASAAARRAAARRAAARRGVLRPSGGGRRTNRSAVLPAVARVSRQSCWRRSRESVGAAEIARVEAAFAQARVPGEAGGSGRMRLPYSHAERSAWPKRARDDRGRRSSWRRSQAPSAPFSRDSYHQSSVQIHRTSTGRARTALGLLTPRLEHVAHETVELAAVAEARPECKELVAIRRLRLPPRDAQTP